jgi:hypothetical protein
MRRININTLLSKRCQETFTAIYRLSDNNITVCNITDIANTRGDKNPSDEKVCEAICYDIQQLFEATFRLRSDLASFKVSLLNGWVKDDGRVKLHISPYLELLKKHIGIDFTPLCK